MILEHNKTAYEEAKKMLLEYRECCIIAATGIGKSNIATEIIQNLGLNALIIAPKASIRDNWTNMPKRYNFAPTISTITYQYFNRHYKSLYGFDAYIFDEAHHAGAPKWGAAIKEFREGLDTEFVLGLTADPNRYSDLFPCFVTDDEDMNAKHKEILRDHLLLSSFTVKIEPLEDQTDRYSKYFVEETDWEDIQVNSEEMDFDEDILEDEWETLE